MADTTYIKGIVEPLVRESLSDACPGHHFAERSVILSSGGYHKFDAVSEDSTIVADILSNRPRTVTGNENTGGVRKAKEDVSLLNLLTDGCQRVMVFTDAGFCTLIRNRAGRQGIEKIKMIICPLPEDIRSELNSRLDAASAEQRHR